MNRGFLTAAIAAALLLAPLAAGVAKGDAAPNLSGTWRLDRAHSDNPGGMAGGGARSWGDVKSENSGGSGSPGAPSAGRSRHGHGGAGGSSLGLPRIPALFSLAMVSDAVEMKDSTGALVERVLLSDAGSVPATDPTGAPQVHGGWQGQALQVDLTPPSGGKVSQSYELADGGQTLKIATQITPGSDQKRAPRTFTRVYTRVSGS